MPLNLIGFAAGLAIAQRFNLAQNRAVPVALVGGLAGNTPMGLAFALVLAQRSAPPPLPPPPPPGQAGGFAPAPGVAQIAARPAVAPAPLAVPTNVTARAHKHGNRFLATVRWTAIPQAPRETAYVVRVYNRVGANDWAVGYVTQSTDADHAELPLPATTTEQTIRSEYGFTVTAMNLREGRMSPESERVTAEIGASGPA